MRWKEAGIGARSTCLPPDLLPLRTGEYSRDDFVALTISRRSQRDEQPVRAPAERARERRCRKAICCRMSQGFLDERVV